MRIRKESYKKIDVVLQRHNAAPTLTAFITKEAFYVAKQQNKSDKFSQQIYPSEFLGDALMSSHYETGYEVGVIIQDEPAESIAARILKLHDLSRESSQLPTQADGFSFSCCRPWFSKLSRTGPAGAEALPGIFNKES